MIRRPPRSTLFPLHDALPISTQWYSVFASGPGIFGLGSKRYGSGFLASLFKKDLWDLRNPDHVNGGVNHFRSEEHTSELQSRLHLVCRLLLEKKKKTKLYYKS